VNAAERLQEVVGDACERPPEERAAFLDEACEADTVLRQEAESLLARAEASGDFLETPAFDLAGLAGTARLLPAQLGEYRLLSLLGQGGMGEVYLADDTSLGRQVAIKLIRFGMASETLLRRFQQEKRILAGLNDPHVARLYGGAMTPEGCPYLVMEYVDGEPLDVYCDRRRLGIEDRLRLFRKVCAAVAHAHQHLVIHRDLKPANIRVTAAGEPKLLDFGIAKLLDSNGEQDAGQTVTRMNAMTPNYASPEQLRGQAVTTATDIYSLGVVLYELLCGQRPFDLKAPPAGDSAPAVRPEIVRNPSTVVANSAAAEARSVTPGRLVRQLAGDLDNIVLKAMRPDPARRYPSVSQFSEDIQRWLECRPVSARKETLRYVGARFIKRNKALTAAVLVILLTLVGGIVGTSWQAHVADEQRRLAQRRFDDVRRLANSLMFEIHDAVQDLAGSTPARKLIVTRALEYLDSLSQGADTPALRRDLAVAYRKVGDVQGNPYVANLGDAAGALKSYRKAEALLIGIKGLRENGGEGVDSSDLQMELGRVYRALGDALDVQGDTDGMLRLYRQSLDLFVQLDRARPGNPGVLDELARAYDTLGAGLGHTNNGQAEQVHCFEEMLAIDQRVLRTAPDDAKARRALAIAFMKLGGITLTDKTHGIADLERSADLLKALAAESPDNGRARREYATALYRLGSGRSEVGDFAGAVPDFEQALKIRVDIEAADPKDQQVHFDVAVARSNLAEALTKSGRASEALGPAQQAVGALEAMMPGAPDNTVYIRNCALFYEKVAHAHAALAAQDSLTAEVRAAHWTAARAAYDKAAALLNELIKKGALRSADRELPAKLAAAILDCDQQLAELRK
jgi:non-specific serine/threonine protein kinase/serine/threonine-protein kinase